MTGEQLNISLRTLKPNWLDRRGPSLEEVAEHVCICAPEGFPVDAKAWSEKAIRCLHIVFPSCHDANVAEMVRYSVRLYIYLMALAEQRGRKATFDCRSEERV
jgi:hypothetical protein